jgi:hypothetical protein
MSIGVVASGRPKIVFFKILLALYAKRIVLRILEATLYIKVCKLPRLLSLIPCVV